VRFRLAVIERNTLFIGVFRCCYQFERVSRGCGRRTFANRFDSARALRSPSARFTFAARWPSL
jgi:hypothetical protein